MNKKLITSILTAGFLFSFVFASSASAFWPFDSLFSKSGNVKAAMTDQKAKMENGNRMGFTPIKTTSKEATALADACRAILNAGTVKPQTKTTQTTTTDPSPDQDVLLDAKSLTDFMSVQKQLVTKCNEIINIISSNRANGVLKKIRSEGEKDKPRVAPSISVTPSPRTGLKFFLKSKNEQKNEKWNEQKNEDDQNK